MSTTTLNRSEIAYCTVCGSNHFNDISRIYHIDRYERQECNNCKKLFVFNRLERINGEISGTIQPYMGDCPECNSEHMHSLRDGTGTRYQCGDCNKLFAMVDMVIADYCPICGCKDLFPPDENGHIKCYKCKTTFILQGLQPEYTTNCLICGKNHFEDTSLPYYECQENLIKWCVITVITDKRTTGKPRCNVCGSYHIHKRMKYKNTQYYECINCMRNKIILKMENNISPNSKNYHGTCKYCGSPFIHRSKKPNGIYSYVCSLCGKYNNTKKMNYNLWPIIYLGECPQCGGTRVFKRDKIDNLQSYECIDCRKWFCETNKPIKTLPDYCVSCGLDSVRKVGIKKDELKVYSCTNGCKSFYFLNIINSKCSFDYKGRCPFCNVQSSTVNLNKQIYKFDEFYRKCNNCLNRFLIHSASNTDYCPYCGDQDIETIKTSYENYLYNCPNCSNNFVVISTKTSENCNICGKAHIPNATQTTNIDKDQLFVNFLTCPRCESKFIRKAGSRRGHQLYNCKSCNKKFRANGKPEGRRFTAEIIDKAIRNYHLGLSYRNVAVDIERTYKVPKPSTGTLYKWINEFANKANDVLQHYPAYASGPWLVDHMPINVLKENVYNIHVIDAASKYLLATEVVNECSQQNVELIIKKALNASSLRPSVIEIPDLDFYKLAISNLLPNTKYKILDHSENISTTEQFQETTKERIDTMRVMTNLETAQNFFNSFSIHYNFFKENSALHGKTPGEAAKVNQPFKTWKDIVNIDPTTHEIKKVLKD